MTDEGPTVSAKQLAMSRALGAAFLTHQVEQLEKTVNARAASGASGNWRDRRQATTKSNAGVGGGSHHYRDRIPASQQQQQQQQQQGKHARKIPGAPPSMAKSAPAVVGTTKKKLTQPPHGRDSPASNRRLSDEERDKYRDRGGGFGNKDVDIVVVDASVLVHALYQVKRWCRDGREEVIIIPLEALNTLDLLKKGTTSLAQRARAASRILEAQVGTNPRIRVQRDEAYVYWDKITFSDDTHAPGSSPTAQQPLPSPEWVRRTVCCAKWTVDNPHIELGPLKLSDGESASASALAPVPVLMPVPVVPLPAPHPQPQGNKFEPRSVGTLISYWASKAGIELLEVDAAAPGHGRGGAARAGAEEDEEVPRLGGGGRKGAKPNAHGHGQGLVERPPAVMAMMEMVSQPSKVRVHQWMIFPSASTINAKALIRLTGRCLCWMEGSALAEEKMRIVVLDASKSPTRLFYPSYMSPRVTSRT
ncbi:hypothetical protein APHAL10511_000419 [Amanita phalloides]|nr:hypothetical protein APHAL10511_000419 [Amanita phalloides]